MATFTLKFIDTSPGYMTIESDGGGETDPGSAAHQFGYAVKKNEQLLWDFVQKCIDSIKTEKEINIIGSQETAS